MQPAHARDLPVDGLMRVRVCSNVPSTHYIELMEWILKHFDFGRGRILVNAVEDIEYFENDIRRCISVARNQIIRGSPVAYLLQTYYFADDELGVYFRLRFA